MELIKRLITTFIVITFALGLPAVGLAAPALPDEFTFEQPDGTQFPAVSFGNEWVNGYETLDGFTIIQNPETGFWHYAMLNRRGELVPSHFRVGLDAPAGISPHLRPKVSADLGLAYTTPVSRAPWPGSSGNQSVLVILVEFTDQASVGTTAGQWNARFFGASNSVKDYYNEVSYGNLGLIPANETFTDGVDGVVNDGIIGWLNIGYNHIDTRGSTGTANRQLTHDALVAADPYINYSSYDTDTDGYITPKELHVVIVAAGYETAYGGSVNACEPSVWGHQWDLGWGGVDAPNLDGVIIGHWSVGGGYTQFGEYHCYKIYDQPGHMATIGIMVHELGHDINWPDLYDTDGSSQGIGYWSVMGSGSWLSGGQYSGDKPSHPDAFSKWYQGWVTPTLVMTSTQELDTGVISLSQVEANPDVVQLLPNPNGVDWNFYNQSGTGEYFLIENRRYVGYDAGLPGCGLLIWHIDESVTSTNSANADEDHPLVDLEEADGQDHLYHGSNRGDDGDPYPGSSTNFWFTNTSYPNSKLYNGSYSGVGVQVLSIACGATMNLQLLYADMEVSKAGSPNPVVAGETLTYTITVTNTGNYTGTLVTMTDTLPAGVTFDQAVSSQGACNHAGGVVTCELGDMGVSDTATVTLTVDTSPNLLGSVDNLVQVDTDTPDPVQSNNTDTETTTINTRADLSITKSDSPDPVLAGNPITYTLDITNNGPSDALTVVVTDTLPVEMLYNQATASQGSCSHAGGVVTCTLGTLPVSATAGVTITTDVDAGAGLGVVQNAAEVSSTTTDPNTGNNTVQENTTITTEADLAIVKTGLPEPVNAGETLTYTLTITNTGPGAVLSVTVTDTLPAGVTFSLANPSQGSCNHSGGVVTCQLGYMAASNQATITIVVDVDKSAVGRITNSVELTSSAYDPNPANNSDSYDTRVKGFIFIPIVVRGG
ncbi:MAG: M6 family metalloprotease domain-containing protein [Chloroflexota bacterium]